MTQDQWQILGFKVVEVSALVSIVAFVLYYSRVAPWWRNPIGRTIVFKDIALIIALIPALLSIFLHFNRLTSHIAGWIDIGTFALITFVMCWRIAVWRRIHKDGGNAP